MARAEADHWATRAAEKQITAEAACADYAKAERLANDAAYRKRLADQAILQVVASFRSSEGSTATAEEVPESRRNEIDAQLENIFTELSESVNRAAGV